MIYTYTFDLLRDNDAGNRVSYLNYEHTLALGGVDPDNYFTADGGTVEGRKPQEACEKLYEIYNRANRPNGYHGRSMCVSDIVNLWDNTQDPPVKTSWFCDSLGFVQIDENGNRIE